MLISFIGTFECNYSKGSLYLPEPFHMDNTILQYKQLSNGSSPWLRFWLPTINIDGTINVPTRPIAIEKGIITLPVSDQEIFEEGSQLCISGFGKGFNVWKESRHSGWHTTAGGCVTLAAVGEGACNLVEKFSAKNMPIDCSSVELLHRQNMLQKILFGFENTKNIPQKFEPHWVSLGFKANENPFIALKQAEELEKSINNALRDTGLLLLVSCVGESRNAIVLPYIQKLAARSGVTVITLVIMPTKEDYHY